ncbi:MAG: PQQ-binding-like beta-propeller repeat protein [Thermoanaerobaculia bacterium]|nr:PQQ-binding-like beta-propeller repeat protein [Thermoanaerobaculia bacterium]
MKAVSRLASALVLVGCAGPVLDVESVDEWRRWRGLNGQGISQETDLPVRWSEASSNIRWKTRIPGAGNSSPIAASGTVFVTTTYGELEDDWDAAWKAENLRRVVVAVDHRSGALRWQSEIFVESGDGRSEVVVSTSKLIVAYDPRSGKRLWTAPQPSIQSVPSLLSAGDLLAAPGGIHDTGVDRLSARTGGPTIGAERAMVDHPLGTADPDLDALRRSPVFAQRQRSAHGSGRRDREEALARAGLTR